MSRTRRPAAVRCEAWACTRSDVSSRFDHFHQCRNPARYRVQVRDRRTGDVDPTRVASCGEHVCGVHVRPALMDNGDSVFPPFYITPLEADPT